MGEGEGRERCLKVYGWGSGRPQPLENLERFPKQIWKQIKWGTTQLHIYQGKGLSSEIKIACTGGHQSSKGIASKTEERGFVIGHHQPGTPPSGQRNQSEGLTQPGTSQAGWVGRGTVAWAHSGLETQENRLRRN